VNLLREISKSRSGEVCVITFYYDVALDYALRFVNMPIDYCFDEPVANAFSIDEIAWVLELGPVRQMSDGA